MMLSFVLAWAFHRCPRLAHTLAVPNVCPDLSQRIAYTDTENRLLGILQDVHDLSRRGLQINSIAVGEQVGL